MIVVGIDQSEGAKAALRFALDEARLRHVPLHTVHAWEFGFIGSAGFEGSLPVTGGDLNDFRRVAEVDLASVLTDVVGNVKDVDIKRVPSKAALQLCSSTNRAAPTCSSSARADMAASRSCFWAPLASSARSTQNAPWSS